MCFFFVLFLILNYFKFISVVFGCFFFPQPFSLVLNARFYFSLIFIIVVAVAFVVVVGSFTIAFNNFADNCFRANVIKTITIASRRLNKVLKILI